MIPIWLPFLESSRQRRSERRRVSLYPAFLNAPAFYGKACPPASADRSPYAGYAAHSPGLTSSREKEDDVAAVGPIKLQKVLGGRNQPARRVSLSAPRGGVPPTCSPSERLARSDLRDRCWDQQGARLG